MVIAVKRFFLSALIFAALWLGSLVPATAQQTACTAGCVNYNTGAAFSGTTLSATLTGVAAGHNIRVWACGQAATTGFTSAVVTIGGTVANQGSVHPVNSLRTCLTAWLGNSAGGSIAASITYVGDTCANCDLNVEDWPTDLAIANPNDGGNNGAYLSSGGSASLSCGNLVTTNSNDNLEVFYHSPQSVALATPPSGYTLAYNSGPNTYQVYYKTGLSPGTYNPSATIGPSAFDNYIMCAAFESSGAGPVGSRRSLTGVGQ